MDPIQIQTILTKIEEFNQLDIDRLLATLYADQDISRTKVNQLTVPEFVNLTRRVLIQLKSELTTGLGLLLPLNVNAHDDFGALNLQNDLYNFYNQIKEMQFKPSEALLLKLAHYQVIHGFFDKSSLKVHDLRGLRITEIENRLKLISDHLTKNIQLRDQIFNELEKKKNEINEFEATKRKQLDQISVNLQTANQQTNQINELLNKSNSSSTRIDTLLEQQNKNLDQASKAIDEARNLLKSFGSKSEELMDDAKSEITQIQDQNIEFKKQLDYVEEKKKIFDERNAYLDELIGREVGASLFETFKQRKNELSHPVRFWKWAVLGMSMITVVGIYAIFTNIFGLYGTATIDLGWERLALNSLKTIPFFILLFFAIRQYSRERTYQEQYAFKSAVALTINAYSKLLTKDESKDQLIVNAVNGIYHSPISAKDKSDSEEKDILETLKNTSETIKNVTKK
ncbi:MAG: hypothetical protein HZB59_07415 [Ignavibacteriales bacterium]|nr:hypothetical protein [Ignavibacteriales bacterium]